MKFRWEDIIVASGQVTCYGKTLLDTLDTNSNVVYGAVFGDFILSVDADNSGTVRVYKKENDVLSLEFTYTGIANSIGQNAYIPIIYQGNRVMMVCSDYAGSFTYKKNIPGTVNLTTGAYTDGAVGGEHAEEDVNFIETNDYYKSLFTWRGTLSIGDNPEIPWMVQNGNSQQSAVIIFLEIIEVYNEVTEVWDATFSQPTAYPSNINVGGRCRFVSQWENYFVGGTYGGTANGFGMIEVWRVDEDGTVTKVFTHRIDFQGAYLATGAMFHPSGNWLIGAWVYTRDSETDTFTNTDIACTSINGVNGFQYWISENVLISSFKASDSIKVELFNQNTLTFSTICEGAFTPTQVTDMLVFSDNQIAVNNLNADDTKPTWNLFE